MRPSSQQWNTPSGGRQSDILSRVSHIRGGTSVQDFRPRLIEDDELKRRNRAAGMGAPSFFGHESYSARSPSSVSSTTKGGKYTPIGKPSSRDIQAAHMTADMEAQNDDLIEELHEKVLGLKQIAYGMREQVQESNTLLDQMGIAMTTAGSLLSGTMKRLKSLTSFRTTRHIWLMMLFFVGVLFVMYLLFGKRR